MIIPETVLPTAKLKPGYKSISPEGKRGLRAIEGEKQRGGMMGRLRREEKFP